MKKHDLKITDYDYIGSTLGNAYFSGVSFEDLWFCVANSKTREELDAAVSATIKFQEMMKGN